MDERTGNEQLRKAESKSPEEPGSGGITQREPGAFRCSPGNE